MINITASVSNQDGDHSVTLSTNDNTHSITIPAKSTGQGSSANGGELLFLALATCYCNDIYREAAKRNIVVRQIDVEVHGQFGLMPGNVAENVTYHATVKAEASEEDIVDLMRHTDTVAEIQNTIRQGGHVTLASTTAVSV